MSRIRSSDTSIELAVRRHLFSKGFRYRLNYPLPGKPDIVFPGKRIAVFVNGCFWHMHGCRLSKTPSARREFWEAKLTGNSRRDSDVRNILKTMGWRVFTIWECEIEKDISYALHPLAETLSSEYTGREEKNEGSNPEKL